MTTPAAGDADEAAAAAASPPPPPPPDRILETLAARGRQRHPDSNMVAVLAPEECDRVPMCERGVTLVFLQRMVAELTRLNRHDADAGQFLNGMHTTSSATDWQEFDRARDEYW